MARGRLARGHLVSRALGRFKREIQAATTTAVLSLTRPRPGHASVVTLNPDEENATAQVVLMCSRSNYNRLSLVTPSPEVSLEAVNAAARRLGLPVPPQLVFEKLSYRMLLDQYRKSEQTYSTHVLLPGRDLSNSRRHVHLTHGSGPKPDSTFRAPTNVLASITPGWVPQQLREYKLPRHTTVISYMPRLEIMQRSIGDSTVLTKLGLDPSRQLVVWAPTYRVVQRGRETRVSGLPLGRDGASIPAEITAAANARDAHLIIKAHPHEADDYAHLGSPVFTNSRLRALKVSSYELFGAADLVITDYSSIYVERAALGLPYLLVQPDKDQFAASYRGFRPGVK